MSSVKARLKRLENIQLARANAVSWNDNIPTEPEAFYQDFGPIRHPITGKPVISLADYQYETWQWFQKYRRILEVKSHKVGETRKWLIVDFQLAVLPSDNILSCRGFDEIVLSQTKDLAIEHLRHLRRMILRSPKYNKYLIDKPTETSEYGELSAKAIMRDERTKTEVIYIRNPDDSTSPTRIIALGADNPGSIESWPNIKHIHVSDITASRRDYKEALNIAMTRLANTNGSMVIETIPGLPVGPVYDMSQMYRAKTELKPGDFKYFEVIAERAVAAGVISPEFLQAERERLPAAEYAALYGAKFTAQFGNVFSADVIERAIELGKKYDPDKIIHGAEKSQGIDEGFGSSNFGICVVQRIDNILQVIMADEHERPDIDQEVYDAAARINSWHIQSTQCDAAQPVYVSALKRKIGENPRYEDLDKESYRWMKVKPIAFSTSHKAMLGNAVMLMEKGKVAIHPKFEKLITALRTAIAQDYSLDKDKTVHDDVLDAFRLSLEPYNVGGKR